MSDEPPVIVIAVDRTRSCVRGLWRLLCAVALGGLMFVLNPDWSLLRLTQPASFIGVAVIWLTGAAAVVAAVFSAGRFLLLACWPGELGIQIDPAEVRLRLGPFGSLSRVWAELDLRPDREIDAELLAVMPDDAFVPILREHGPGRGDLSALILAHGQIDPEGFTRLMRPYLALAERSASGVTSP